MKIKIPSKELINSREARVVALAYLIVLNRYPDEEGLKHWTEKLSNDEIDETDLYYYLMTSDEYEKQKKEVK